ncbi:hypothetical protein K443DRAFT_14742 [Laccaria amethystina LaAM-08-1]|uniref:Uncharacterized protein n=1 Tax=Laccaria amethystina LaAM-08-1 TaxID=1095629 RepID=A0A0C9X3D0_9AGAR|nr:hypothetical protein K443DRAFT_14742 [Laccaria amethystina LaAM-08-1]
MYITAFSENDIFPERVSLQMDGRANSTPDREDFFSSTNAELCLSPTKIDVFPQSGFL